MPQGLQTKVGEKDKIKPTLTQAVSTDIAALRQLPLAEGYPGDWQALQLWCGHWGRHLDTLSRAQGRHEKLSHIAAITQDCGGKLIISYCLITACDFP